MTVTVIVMIMIGIGFVIASFFITEKLSKKEESYKLDLLTVDDNYEFSDREQQIIKRKIEDVIAEHAKDIIYETNESLSNMANEKTMALGDYAVAVCDEIEKNHKEVMFLYSMLDDKQKEIMQTVRDVDSAKNDVKKMITEVSDLKASDSKMSFNDSLVDRINNSIINSNNNVEDNIGDTQISNNTDLEDSNTEKLTNDKINDNNFNEEEMALDAELNDIFAELDSTDVNFDEVLENDFKDDSNANDIILEMYRNGNSVIDIAKQLGLGVGEVKLVIDLYQGDNK